MVLEDIDIAGFLSWFENIGGFDIILPFLLVFAITFAILDKIKLFGEKKNINTIIAIILAFFLILQQDFVFLLQGVLPRVSMLMVTLIMILLVAGTFGFSEFGEGWKSLSVIVAIVGVIWAIGASSNWDIPAFDLLTDQDIAILLILGVFVLVIWFVVKEPSKTGEGGIIKGLRDFNNFFGLSKKP
ncbi:hypothetical protein J4442_02380 [Candidatus Woesearchaeota archaeon]|nr:hypothetical protein [Candidatus Woesearchaeota archaeon]